MGCHWTFGVQTQIGGLGYKAADIKYYETARTLNSNALALIECVSRIRP